MLIIEWSNVPGNGIQERDLSAQTPTKSFNIGPRWIAAGTRGDLQQQTVPEDVEGPKDLDYPGGGPASRNFGVGRVELPRATDQAADATKGSAFGGQARCT